MTFLLLQFVALSLVVVLAGTGLARSADRLAESTGIGRSLAGLVLLAGATSLPELSVGWSAVRLGADDLALGGLLGSSLFNLLILAVLDLLTRSRGRILSKMAAAHAISAIASILLTSIVLLFLVLKTGRVWQGMGPGSAAVLLAYLFSLRLIYFDQQSARTESLETVRPKRHDWRYPLGVYLAGAGVIFVTAPQLTVVAEDLATRTGLGNTFFGTAFLAAVTSLPEAVTTLAAIRLGTIDMAVGNIFGSNAFNMVLIGIIDAASPTPLLSVTSSTHAITATAAILVTAVATTGLLYRAEKRWWIIEPDALLVTLLVLGALTLVYLQ